MPLAPRAIINMTARRAEDISFTFRLARRDGAADDAALAKLELCQPGHIA